MSNQRPIPLEERVLLLAPTARDAWSGWVSGALNISATAISKASRWSHPGTSITPNLRWPVPRRGLTKSRGDGRWRASWVSASCSARSRSSRGSAACSASDHVSEEQPLGIHEDPLFAGVTRPAMAMGVTYSALLINGTADPAARFVAATLPPKVRIGNTTAIPSTDPRFQL